MKQNRTEFLHFKDWFTHEFTRRCKKNPKYSIRSFSLLLNMDSSSVSQMLSGKRKPSKKMIERLTNILSAPPSQKEILLKNTQETVKAKKNNHYRQLALDTYSLIAEWYHYAILELTYIINFKSEVRWIAKQLGITTAEARIAISRLERLKLLKKSKTGEFSKSTTFITNFSPGITSSSLKQLQKSVLNMGIEAIDNVPIEEKDFTSMTMAICPEKLPEARKRITNFRRELSEFLEEGDQTRVYNLGIQLYPISKKNKESK